MAFTFSVNSTPATASIAMYALVTALVAAGWTKVADSDGTTYSAAGTQVTSGNTGAGGLDNTNAWIYLRAPAYLGQQRGITIQRGNTNLLFRAKYSASAGFSGGAPAATVTPSATDEVIFIGAGTDAAPTFTSFPTNGTYRMHIAAGGAAEGYAFWLVMLTTSTTTALRIMFLDVLVPGTYGPTDPDPAVIGWTATTAIGDFINVVSGTTNPKPSAAWMGATSVAANNVNLAMYTYGGFNPALGGSSNIGQNPFSVKDTQYQVIWGRGAGSAAPNGIKGVSSLFRACTMARANMDTFSVSATRDFVFFQGMALAWDGSVPVL